MINIAINSMNAGELSPKMNERFDVQKYQSGCRVLENMYPSVYGGVERRPGTLYVDTLETPGVDWYAPEYYNAYSNAYSTYWLAQVFTPSKEYTLYSVRLYLKKSGTPVTPMTCSIKGVTGGKPTEADLASCEVNPSILTTSYQWIDFVFTEPLAVATDSSYAIVLKVVNSANPNHVRWARDSTSPAYSGGTGCTSANSGSTWTVADSDYLFRTYEASTTSGIVRLESFTYNSSISYLMEFGDKYIRFYYNDAIVYVMESPYSVDDLFELHIKQVADVMRITHASYAPRKLSRVSGSEFVLEEIPFKRGPFLLRNDLINPDCLLPASMSYEGGILTCDGNIFEEGHIGSLFKLTHKRKIFISSGTFKYSYEVFAAFKSWVPYIICKPIPIYGTFRMRSHGTWTARLVFQRKQTMANEDAWEDVEVLNGKNDQNIDYTTTEVEENIEYRAVVQEYTGGLLSADIISKNPVQEGIVRITSIIDDYTAYAEPVIAVSTTDTTIRWAEGAWSGVCGYPSTLTIFENRCVYAGDRAVRAQIRPVAESPE